MRVSQASPASSLPATVQFQSERIPLMCSISRLRTVRSDRAKQALPPLGRIEDLSVVNTVLPKSFQTLTTPRSRCPDYENRHQVSRLSVDLGMTLGFGSLTIADLAISCKEIISIGVYVIESLAIVLSITIATALNMHVTIASDTAIAHAFGIAVAVAPSITDELTNIVFVVCGVSI